MMMILVAPSLSHSIFTFVFVMFFTLGKVIEVYMILLYCKIICTLVIPIYNKNEYFLSCFQLLPYINKL